MSHVEPSSPQQWWDNCQNLLGEKLKTDQIPSTTATMPSLRTVPVAAKVEGQ